MKRGILSIMVLCLLSSNIFAGENDLKEKLKNLREEERKGQKAVVDDLLRNELYDYLNKNQSVPVRSFKKFRLTAYASRAIVKDLNKRYGATAEDYQIKITNENERGIYRIALKIMHKDYYDNFYVCKGEDEKKVKESWEKVQKIKKYSGWRLDLKRMLLWSVSLED